MRSIRRGCFETNSSSTHAIAVSTKKWSEWYRRISLASDDRLHIQFREFDGYEDPICTDLKEKIAFCLQFELHKAGWFFYPGDLIPSEELEEFEECLYNLPVYREIAGLLCKHEPKCQGLKVDRVTGIIDHQTLTSYFSINELLEDHNISLEDFLFGDTYLIMGRD